MDFTRATWRKSTRSQANGDCVEIAFAGWHTSTSSYGDGNCVEVGSAPGHVGVRDSKSRVTRHLTFVGPAWSAFLTAIR